MIQSKLPYSDTSGNEKKIVGKWSCMGARGGTLGISGWGCAAGILEPLTYTRASSAEFC